MADVQHRAHLTWAERPQMYLTVQADERVGEDDPTPVCEGYWEVRVTADIEVEETLDVPSGGDRDQSKAAATAALLACSWHPHGDWVDEPYETTVIVKQTPANYDTEDPMADVPHPQAELEAKLAEVYPSPKVPALCRHEATAVHGPDADRRSARDTPRRAGHAERS